VKGLAQSGTVLGNRRLFHKLRLQTQRLEYVNYSKYRKGLDEIPSMLDREWTRIEKDFQKNHHFIPKRLRGYLLEVLFYYACLRLQAVFMDAELAEFGGAHFDTHPPWFEATPLYDIVAPLHHTKEEGRRKRRVPQTRADFPVTYVDDRGPLATSLVDVKSRKPKRWRDEWGWQIPAAMRRGFTFQIAYPKLGIEYQTSLDQWETATSCSNCKSLSGDPRKCSEYGEEIYRFTIIDSYYEAKDLWRELGKERSGRF
jgi:hypothetical protein